MNEVEWLNVIRGAKAEAFDMIDRVADDIPALAPVIASARARVRSLRLRMAREIPNIKGDSGYDVHKAAAGENPFSK